MPRRRLGGRRKDVSAGLLVWRIRRVPEFLLAHPGGPYWARKDDGAWTIPKGLVEGEIDGGDELLATAFREFLEETGLDVAGDVSRLAPVTQSSGKTVHGFALEADLALDGFRSNAFEMEWPPRSGRVKQFPEVDRIAYFDYATALTKIIGYQRPLIEELNARISEAAIPQ